MAIENVKTAIKIFKSAKYRHQIAILRLAKFLATFHYSLAKFKQNHLVTQRNRIFSKKNWTQCGAISHPLKARSD